LVAKKTFKNFAKTGEQNIARISNFRTADLEREKRRQRREIHKPKEQHTVEPPVGDHPKCKD